MRKFLVVALLVLPLAAAACSKAPAEAALRAADEAIAKVKPEAQKYVPAEFEALAAAVAQAKAKFDAGDYAAALEAAKDVPAKATDVASAAAARKDELMRDWNELSGTFPGVLQGLTDKVGALAAMKRLPKGFEPAQLETAKASLTEITELWTAASEAFNTGDIVGATSKTADLKTKADALTTLLAAVEAPPAKK